MSLATNPMIANVQMLAAVNDEAGIVFLMDKTTGKIITEVPFRESGDFEGVEIVGNDAWAIKSNGSLYCIKDFAQPDPEVTQYKSFLNKDNDVEGLAHDPKNNRLLLGCKGKGVDGDGTALKKAVYAFDLETRTVAEKPAFLLTLPDLKNFLINCGEEGVEGKMERICTPEELELKFSPSGIAIHPKTGEIYVTSARGNSLLVLDPTGKILHLEHLKKSIHTQPEGLCFDPKGTLYIANEGNSDTPGRIYAFYAQ